MTVESLKRFLQAFNGRRPFQPFQIEFQSGARITIGHPEVIYPFGDGYLYRGPDNMQHVFESESVVQFIDVPR